MHHLLKQFRHKFEPWSDWITEGIPTKQKKLVTALTVVLGLIFLKVIAPGKRVDEHIIASKYCFCFGKRADTIY